MRQIDEITKRIASLERDIESTDADITRLTSEATTADASHRLELIRQIVEARELSRLNRLALQKSRADLAAAHDVAARDERIARRNEMTSIIDAVEKDAEVLQRSLRRSGRIYQRLNESIRRIMELGASAEAFDVKTFKTTYPAKAPYVFAVHAFAEAFALTPADHLERWPKPNETAEGMARAFASIYRSRDEWRSPELFTQESTENVPGYREATSEEIAHVV